MPRRAGWFNYEKVLSTQGTVALSEIRTFQSLPSGNFANVFGAWPTAAGLLPSLISGSLLLIHMTSQTSRSRPATRTLAERRALIPTEQELQLLASYVRGHITLEEANELLHQMGRFIIALCDYPVMAA